MLVLGCIWAICIGAFIYGIRRFRHSRYFSLIGATIITPVLSHIDGIDGIFAVYPMIVGLPAIVWEAITSGQLLAGVVMFLGYGLLPYLVVAALTYGAISTRKA